MTTAFLDEIEQNLKHGKYYEAQQMFHGMAMKLVNTNKFDKAIVCLVKGIHKMFEAKQPTLARDLSVTIVQVFEKCKANADEEKFVLKQGAAAASPVQILKDISQIYPKDETTEQIKFLKSCLTWVKTQKSTKSIEIVSHLLAKAYHETGDYYHSNKHFLEASCPQEHAELLIDWSDDGYGYERDLFITRAIFQLLVAKKPEVKQTYSYFMNMQFTLNQQNPSQYEPDHFGTKAAPLCHFLELLFVAMETKNAGMYKYLVVTYGEQLDRDASFKSTYLPKIGEAYFGIKQNSSGGFESMLTNIMGSLFGGGNNNNQQRPSST